MSIEDLVAKYKDKPETEDDDKMDVDSDDCE